MGLNAPRVLVLGAVLGQPKGGVWRHNRELLPRAARLLNEGGGSLAVLEGRDPCAFDLPREVERIPSSVPAHPVLRRALAEGHALRRLLDERSAAGRPFELVHTAHQPVPRGFETPLALLVHDLRALELAHSPFSRRLVAREILGRAARRAAVVMTVSEAMADELAAKLGHERAAVRVVPNAADHFQPLPRRLGPGAPLVCVAHLEPRKNQELLLEALSHDPGLPDAHFAGAAKGDEEARLRSRAAELGVAERVRFLGVLSDEELQELYAQAACVVLPSRLEGFGIVALEAQLAGVPLALSAIPAHLEVAAPGTPSFAPADARACAAAIRSALVATPDELAAAERSAHRYRWDDSARALLSAWSAASKRH
jgi:glycosyltransferase involved in cell wall biosynthesis